MRARAQMKMPHICPLLSPLARQFMYPSDAKKCYNPSRPIHSNYAFCHSCCPCLRPFIPRTYRTSHPKISYFSFCLLLLSLHSSPFRKRNNLHNTFAEASVIRCCFVYFLYIHFFTDYQEIQHRSCIP